MSTPQGPGSDESAPRRRPRHAKPEPEQPEVSPSIFDESAEPSAAEDDAGQSEVTFSIFDDPAVTRTSRPGSNRRRPAVSYSLIDEPAEDTTPAPSDESDSTGFHDKDSSGRHEEREPSRPDVTYGGLPSDSPGPTEDEQGRQTWSIVGFVFAAIALVFFPIIFGVIGIGFGVYAHTRGEKLGYWAAIAALTALLAGLAIRIFFFDATLIPEQD